MVSSTINKATFLLFSLALNFLVPSTKARAFLTNEQYADPSTKYTVYIINNLAKTTQTLHIFCNGKVKEVPQAALRNPGDYFKWSFQLKPGQTEDYVCLFQVNDITFTEHFFDKDLVHYCKSKDGYNCVWSAREDGFYISNHFPPTNLTKMYKVHWS